MENKNLPIISVEDAHDKFYDINATILLVKRSSGSKEDKRKVTRQFALKLVELMGQLDKDVYKSVAELIQSDRANAGHDVFNRYGFLLWERCERVYVLSRAVSNLICKFSGNEKKD